MQGIKIKAKEQTNNDSEWEALDSGKSLSNWVAFVHASTQSLLSPAHLINRNSKNLASSRYKYE